MPPSVRYILALAIPMALEQFLVFGLPLFDTAVAGHLGVNEISAQAVVMRWVQFTSVIFMITSVGGSILVAQAIGGKDEVKANEFLLGSTFLALVSGIAVTLIVILLSPYLMSVIGVESAVADLGTPYMRLIAISFPFTFMLLTATGCVRGAGNARVPLFVIGIANGIHVVVALLLVYRTELGLLGIATATIISRGFGFLLILYFIRRGIAGLRLVYRIPTFAAMKGVVWVGSAVGGEQLALRLGQLVNLRLVTSLGTELFAVYVIVINSLSIILLVGIGFMAATLTIVGQQFGAHEEERIYRTTWRIMYISWAIMGGISLLFFVFPFVVTLFSSNPEIQELAAMSLRVILLSVLFETVNQIITGALRGSGDTRYPMLVTIFGQWIIRLPLIILFIGPLGMGLDGIWIAMIIEMAARAVLNILRLRGSFKFKQKRQPGYAT